MEQKTKNQRFLAHSPRTSNETGSFLTNSAPDPAHNESSKLPSQSRSSSGKAELKRNKKQEIF